jgi:hypothetical protein
LGFSCELRNGTENSYETLALVSKNCQTEVKVFRTSVCPMAGFAGKETGKCRRCDTEGEVCPGGDRLWAKRGYCPIGPLPATSASSVAACAPKEACLGVRTESVCAPGYGNAKGQVCCSDCARGFVRTSSGACIPAWKGIHSWLVFSLLLVMCGLGAVAWLGRSETIYVYPFVVMVFRLTGALALTSLNLVNTCTWGAGFGFELFFFPMFTGLVDYLHEALNPVARLIGQLLFTTVYLIPLLAPAAALWFLQRRGAAVSPRPDVALARGLRTWLFLMVLPLAFILTGSWLCSGGTMANYPQSKCGSGAHIGAVVLSLLGLGVLVWSMVKVGREVHAIANNRDGREEDYLKCAFVYGALNDHHTGAWVLDLVLGAAVVSHRSFFAAAPLWGAILVSGIVLVLIAYVFRFRPFRDRFTNLAYGLSLVAILMAQWIRYLRTNCSGDVSAEEEAQATKGPDGESSSPRALQFFSITIILVYLAALIMAALGARKSVERKGVIKFHAFNYAAMDDDGTAPKLGSLPTDHGPQDGELDRININGNDPEQLGFSP